MLQFGPDHASLHTLRDAVAHHLREEIVTGELRPGQTIKDVELAIRLGISTTPVREALSQLSLERLIDMPPNRPKRIAPLSKRFALEMYSVFRLLSSAAYERGVPNLSPADVIELRADNDRLVSAIEADDRRAAIAASRDFHDRVIRAAGNGELRRMCSRSFVWLERVFYALANVDRARPAVAHQLDIVTALERGETPRAVESLRNAADSFATIIEDLPDDGDQARVRLARKT